MTYRLIRKVIEVNYFSEQLVINLTDVSSAVFSNRCLFLTKWKSPVLIDPCLQVARVRAEYLFPVSQSTKKRLLCSMGRTAPSMKDSQELLWSNSVENTISPRKSMSYFNGTVCCRKMYWSDFNKFSSRSNPVSILAIHRRTPLCDEEHTWVA